MSALESLSAVGATVSAKLNSLLEAYIRTRMDHATTTAIAIEARHPDLSPTRRAQEYYQRQARLNAVVGASTGGVMLMPGGKGAYRLVMILGDALAVGVAGIDVMLTVAALHGHHPRDAQQARAWLVDAMTAPEDLTHHVTAPLPLRAEDRAVALANAPMPAALSLRGQVPVRIAMLTLPEPEDGAPLWDWRVAVRLLIGSSAGAYLDMKSIISVGELAERFFGPVQTEDREAMEQRVEEIERLLDSPDEPPAPLPEA